MCVCVRAYVCVCVSRLGTESNWLLKKYHLGETNVQPDTETVNQFRLMYELYGSTVYAYEYRYYVFGRCCYHISFNNNDALLTKNIRHFA